MDLIEAEKAVQPIVNWILAKKKCSTAEKSALVDVYPFLVSTWATAGRFPSLREINRHLGYTSTSLISLRLGYLCGFGLIVYNRDLKKYQLEGATYGFNPKQANAVAMAYLKFGNVIHDLEVGG